MIVFVVAGDSGGACRGTGAPTGDGAARPWKGARRRSASAEAPGAGEPLFSPIPPCLFRDERVTPLYNLINNFQIYFSFPTFHSFQ